MVVVVVVRTVALDVHKRFAEVAVIENGALRRLGRIETDQLGVFAESLGPGDHVVLESTAMTWAIAERLAEHAGRVTVANPMRTRAIASAKVKTDKIDANVLAQLGAADFLPEVWAPDEVTRALRRRIAHRSSLVRQRTRLRNQVHAVLTRNLIEAPRLASAQQGRGLPLRRADDHPAQAAHARAQRRRHGPTDQSRRRDQAQADGASLARRGRAQLPQLRRVQGATRRGRRPRGHDCFGRQSAHDAGRLHSPQTPALLVRVTRAGTDSCTQALTFHPYSSVQETSVGAVTWWRSAGVLAGVAR